MKISSINITDFRSLRHISLDKLDPRVNLFIGENGAGKSSVLDALSLLFSWYVARLISKNGKGKKIPADAITKNSSEGCSIEVTIDGEDRWKLYRSLKYNKKDKSDLSAMNRQVSAIREEMEEGLRDSIPVFVHYSVNRTVPDECSKQATSPKEPTVLDALKNSVGSTQLFNNFFNWFRQAEDYENERCKDDRDYKDPGLEAVREAMRSIFPDYGDMRVSRRPLALLMKKGAEEFKISQLSDGEKCYISVVGDLARRLAIANPSGNPLEGNGIVLIDEIDLHLHPKWQQTVVSNLVKTFPGCQFFITTHSPIVASDAQGEVFSLNNGIISPKNTFGKLSSDILSSAFDVCNARNQEVQEMIETTYEHISRSDFCAYEKELGRLMTILGADDPVISSLKIECLRKKKSQSNEDDKQIHTPALS